MNIRIQFEHEAGPQHDDLAARLLDIAHQVAPLVEDVTRLPLPSSPLIRLITLKAGKTERETMASRAVTRDALLWKLDEETVQKCRTNRAIWAQAWEKLAVLIPMQYTESAAGRPAVLIHAESVYHAQYDDDHLYTMMAGGFTALAQYQASYGHMFRLVYSPYSRHRPEDHPHLGSLTEGHGYWTSRQVTSSILGREVSWGDEVEGTEHYREVLRPVKERVAANQAECDKAAAFIEYVVGKIGIAQFNCVWKTAQFPTPSHIESPDSYVDFLRRNPVPIYVRRPHPSPGTCTPKILRSPAGSPA
ncbi:hypothetical protein ACFU99_11555 [Streptomyces sp. NPDC057654]|uniref:hypothetical protein n=1 Tax=Streptomyces sp. NPDC057654 TaxID=3346196 RepID=UPI00367C8E31